MIERHGLHGPSDETEPVTLRGLLEPFITVYWPLPRPVNAFRMQVGAVERLVYNCRLRSISRSATLRYVQGHEYGHVVCEHQGSIDMWGGGKRYLMRVRQDREADEVAAYLLVRMDALRAMRGEGGEYIARMIDVPESLVRVRWEMCQAGVR